MAFTVVDFRDALALGGARPNQFEITLPFPGLAGGGGAQTTFLAHAASIPSSDLGVCAGVNYFGRQLKYPGDRVFQDWTISIYVDEDFALRDSFEVWSGVINSHVGNLRNAAALNPAAYEVDATVTQFGKSGLIRKEYTMAGCWPSAISPIALEWGNNDQIESFDVTFQYLLWTATTTDQF